jgi:hypothetical protein
MRIHTFYKKNEHILEYYLSKLEQTTFVVTLCVSNTWINTFCKRINMSYIKVNDLSQSYVKRIASTLLVRPTMLYVFSGGTEYWLIRSFLDHCSRYPTMIVTSFNYIMGIDKQITTPYTPNIKSVFDINYQGCSINAMITLLKKYKYEYVGMFRYAQGAIFIRESHYDTLYPFEPNISDMLSLPNVVYALEHRWPKVSNKCWVHVK